MLKSFQNLKGTVTLFHNPSSQVSNNLKAYIAQKFANPASRKINVDVTESAPTTDQLKALLQYTGNDTQLQERIKSGFVRPVLVDWDRQKLAVNDEAAAKQILDSLK